MQKEKSSKLLSILIINSLFIFLIYFTWHKTGDLIVDCFEDIWVAQKIVEGKILYIDIYYLFGFLPPYCLSFLMKFTGIHINAKILLEIIIIFFMNIFIYRIGRFFLNRFMSTLLVANFLLVFAFPDGIFNFIFPYNMASTFFILFTTAGLFFF